MKKTLLALAIALLVSGYTLAQDMTKPGDTKQDSVNAQGTSKKAATISGQVSHDGKALVSDEDIIWAVSNPNALTGHEGQLVAVKCQVFPGKNEIHVFFVNTGQGETKFAANKGDSAFRR
jgi:membrane protein implicated in regulation of membrane protease activity